MRYLKAITRVERKRKASERKERLIKHQKREGIHGIMVSNKEHKKRESLHEKLQLLRSITHSHSVIPSLLHIYSLFIYLFINIGLPLECS